MPSTINLIQRNSPGTYVSENTYGAVPALLENHGNVYVLGTCTSASFPYNKPVYISNYTDFITQCVSSPSAAAVKLFFDQRSGSGLYFVRVPIRAQATISIERDLPQSTELSITLDSGYRAIYATVAGDERARALTGLGKAINTSLAGVASFYRLSEFFGVIRIPVGSTASGSPGILGLENGTIGTLPNALDVADSIAATFVPEDGQGYICAPEFYQRFDLNDRAILAGQLEAFVSDPRFYWVSVVDFGQDTATASYLVNSAKAERARYSSTRGNSWAVFPYVKNLTGTLVPPSLAMIGVALRRARSEGFAQPPAGANYPVYGVTGLSANISNSTQDALNPLGINCLRDLPARGVVVYGARTMSPSNFYRFASTRVILNVLAGTLRNSFNDVVFSLVDGQGVLFSRIKQTAANICEQLRLGGALYGATPDEAYLVVCDSTNNPGDSLDAGTVNLDVIVKPSPTTEVLNISLSRASLSTVLVEISTSGDTDPIAA